jgi:hypothetical protein
MRLLRGIAPALARSVPLALRYEPRRSFIDDEVSFLRR